MEVYQDTQCSIEKRVAAYLILMKTPDNVLIRDIVNNLENLEDEELQSFVVSHLNNSLNSNNPHFQQ